MKKGFSGFNSFIQNLSNQHPQQTVNPQQNHHQQSTNHNKTNTSSQNPNNNEKSLKNDQYFEKDNQIKHEPQSEQNQHPASQIPQTSQNLQPNSQNHFPKSTVNNVQNSCIRSNSGSFSPVPDNQYFSNNSFSQFNESFYSMMLGQMQNHAPNMAASHANNEAMIMSLFQVIQTQAKSLQTLYQKVQRMTQKINQFGHKMRQMKKIKKEGHHIEQEIKPTLQHLGPTLENIDSKTLIKILFGSNKVYEYRLELNQPLDLPLYRERNFSISLKLINMDGKIVKNNNKIPLSLAIYSSENPPKFIEKNTAGQKILKGYIQQSLHHGQCRFQKIQIKEVTSHFRNGWVFIVIIPCMTPLGSANPSDNFVDYLKIQPMVLEKVVVKAKKIKDAKKAKESSIKNEDSQMIEMGNSEIAQLSQQQKAESNQKIPAGKKETKQQNEKVQNSEQIFEDK